MSAPVRPRILLAPVTVSPTKPLTPTHLKYLLSLDMLRRATSTFADVTHLYHHATYAPCRQVAGFWEYLDRCHPGTDYGALGEEDIGELYVAHHREPPLPYAELEPAVLRAEAGWTHPATARLLDIWEEHYRTLGLADTALGRSGPEPAGEDEMLDLLRRRDLCIDGRPVGAPVYLDGTRAGLPLRGLRSADGQRSYLLPLLRELVPAVAGHDLVILAHDDGLRADYQLVAHVLTALGSRVVRYELPRVRIGGVARSTRHGGWHGHTLDAFAPPLIAEAGPDAFRLGLRLHLVAGLGRTARESFDPARLRRWVRRAAVLLAEHPGPGGDCTAYLSELARARGYAEPYRVATGLLTRGAGIPAGDLLRILLEPAAGTVPAGVGR
jgi:hypothetical protein